MESGRPIVVLDPHDWLPGQGETSVAFRSDDLDWIVEIKYHDVSRAGLLKRELRFHGVCCFYEALFPGPQLLTIDRGGVDRLGALVEYLQSDAALAWTQYWQQNSPGGRSRVVKHFSMIFLAENVAFETLAEGFVLTDPVPA